MSETLDETLERIAQQAQQEGVALGAHALRVLRLTGEAGGRDVLLKLWRLALDQARAVGVIPP